MDLISIYANKEQQGLIKEIHRVTTSTYNALTEQYGESLSLKHNIEERMQNLGSGKFISLLKKRQRYRKALELILNFKGSVRIGDGRLNTIVANELQEAGVLSIIEYSPFNSCRSPSRFVAALQSEHYYAGAELVCGGKLSVHKYKPNNEARELYKKLLQTLR